MWVTCLLPGLTDPVIQTSKISLGVRQVSSNYHSEIQRFKLWGQRPRLYNPPRAKNFKCVQYKTRRYVWQPGLWPWWPDLVRYWFRISLGRRQVYSNYHSEIQRFKVWGQKPKLYNPPMQKNFKCFLYKARRLIWQPCLSPWLTDLVI